MDQAIFERFNWNRREVFSLLALLAFHADKFCKICGVLAQSWVLINKTGSLESDSLSIVGGNLGELERQCEEIGLPLTQRRVQRLKDALNRPGNIPWQSISRQFSEIYQTVIDELDARLMICLPNDRASFYTGHDLFGAEVARNFPSASGEITEAGKCLALNRNTASVFHLMRIMEIGLRALGRSLNGPRLDPRHNPSWEMILRRCDQEMQKPLAQRSDDWRRDESFYSTATANLRVVKDAWRNSTMHVERVYDDETALDVWNAVRAFMRQLSIKLTDASV